MVQKPRHGRAGIQRRKLMAGAGWQPLGNQIGRGRRAGCNQKLQIRRRLAKSVDQRQHRQALSDTCCVKPDQTARGAGQGGIPQTFAYPRFWHAMLAQLTCNLGPHQRGQQRRGTAIKMIEQSRADLRLIAHMWGLTRRCGSCGAASGRPRSGGSSQNRALWA